MGSTSFGSQFPLIASYRIDEMTGAKRARRDSFKPLEQDVRVAQEPALSAPDDLLAFPQQVGQIRHPGGQAALKVLRRFRDPEAALVRGAKKCTDRSKLAAKLGPVAVVIGCHDPRLTQCADIVNVIIAKSA